MSELVEAVEQRRMRGATVDYVINHLRDGIFQGQYAPGQRLVEADLTRELGISRGPLREALHRLAADKLLEIVPNRGALVRRLSLREMLELFSIRIALETLAVREATARLADPAIRFAGLDAIAYSMAQGALRLHMDRSLSGYLWSWLEAAGVSFGQDTQNQR